MTLLSSCTIAATVGIWTGLISGFDRPTRLAIVVSCIALPFGALAPLGFEILTGAGRALLATVLYKMIVPAIVLLLSAIAVVVPVHESVYNSTGSADAEESHAC